MARFPDLEVYCPAEGITIGTLRTLPRRVPFDARLMMEAYVPIRRGYALQVRDGVQAQCPVCSSPLLLKLPTEDGKTAVIASVALIPGDIQLGDGTA